MAETDNITVDEGVYVPFEWIDDPDNYTPITAERMNHIEQGIAKVSQSCDSINQTLKVDGLIEFVRFSANEWGLFSVWFRRDGVGYELSFTTSGIYLKYSADGKLVWSIGKD